MRMRFYTGLLGRTLELTLLVATIWYAAGTTVGAHIVTTGLLTFTAGQPITGRPLDVQLTIQRFGGLPATLSDVKVILDADMTAHRMVPVRATLTKGLPDYKRGGQITFTMPGEWRMTLKLIEANEGERVAVFPLTVLRSDAVPATNSLTIQVDLEPALRPTVFEPWNVVWVSVGLILLLEALAVGGYLHRAARA